jgi:hypothetical protein
MRCDRSQKAVSQKTTARKGLESGTMPRKSACASNSDAPVSEEMRMLVGANCKAARIKAGLSQELVSERTGIPQSGILMVEQGK